MSITESGGEPPVDQSDVERDLDKTRIRIIGARAVWATWAQQQAGRAAEDGDAAAGDAEWRGLSVIDDALRAPRPNWKPRYSCLRRSQETRQHDRPRQDR